MDTPDTNYQKLETPEPEQIIKIPDNPLAKLMYYLECICTVIDSDIEKRYTNYNNYSLLTSLERKTVLKLVSKFNPKIMIELNLFKIEPDFVPIDKENEFYEITDEIFEGKINSEVIIEEVTMKVLKVMVCKQSWINKYFEEPIKEYEEYEKKIETENEKKESKPNYFNYHSPYFQKQCTCCACSCDCCCNYDCDACCEENCCCCGIPCPSIYCCDSNICCGSECSCYCCREATAVVFWTIVIGGCLVSWIAGCISACI